jgi:hypothetical protein
MPRMMISGHEYQIDSGPSKMGLMFSLFESNSRHIVTFELKGIGTVAVQINGLSREDVSGESWIVTGYQVLLGVREMRPIKGYFDTQTRKGYLVANPS